MRSRNRYIVILICLFLISFKVAAGSIFIDAALERVQMHQTSFADSVAEQNHIGKDAADGQQQSHTLYLMSHVTANISEICTTVFLQSISAFKFFIANEVLFTQNFADTAFKPPKIRA